MATAQQGNFEIVEPQEVEVGMVLRSTDVHKASGNIMVTTMTVREVRQGTGDDGKPWFDFYGDGISFSYEGDFDPQWEITLEVLRPASADTEGQ